MNPNGIRTFFTFYGDYQDDSWPFKTSHREHTWEGHRLPAVPVVGTRMHFSNFPEDKKRFWEVSSVLWVYGERPQGHDITDMWHLEVSLR